MTTEQLFTQALLLESPWRVVENSFEGEPKCLVLHLELAPGTRALPCPECGADGCAIHDRRERSWRHLNFWQYQTLIHAWVPRVRCAKCGTHQVEVPWARPGTGFTLLFEAFVLELIRHMPESGSGNDYQSRRPQSPRFLPHARQVRTEYQGALCHVMARVNWRRGSRQSPALPTSARG